MRKQTCVLVALAPLLMVTVAAQMPDRGSAAMRKSAAQGNAQAQFNLGVMYDRGDGVPQVYAEAAKWYRLAAAQGTAQAQNDLGVMYDRGQGVPQDYAEAAKWYRLAAAQGNAAAQFNLGVIYQQGRGVPQDYVEAHRWINLAASRASGEDQKLYAEWRDSLAKKMPPQQLAEAQRLAREWRPTKKIP